MELTFLGAAGTVTGSKYLLESNGLKLLIDCGLFQGLKQLRLKNWAKLPIQPSDIHAVVLTHAHIDHSGYLPLLVKNGFSAKEDAEQALALFEPVAFAQDIPMGHDTHIRLLPNGHILGSASLRVANQHTSVTFSGDVGRPNDILMHTPNTIAPTDYLVLESTYGNRLHDNTDPMVQLANVINKTVKRKGVVLIPVFAVGRAQELLYYIHLLKQTGQIADDIPVYLNSPMAVDATAIFSQHRGEHKLSPEQCRAMSRCAHMVNSVDESKRLNELKGPMIILSASGMASGGRVIHHLKAFAPKSNNTVLFVGFQAAGTRGAAMIDGAENIKIHGEYIPVRAKVEVISNLSAHADYEEILAWLKPVKTAPKHVFITHGEPVAADMMRRHVEERLHWSASVPEYLEKVNLS